MRRHGSAGSPLALIRVPVDLIAPFRQKAER
jgi:hypothetical protein